LAVYLRQAEHPLAEFAPLAPKGLAAQAAPAARLTRSLPGAARMLPISQLQISIHHPVQMLPIGLKSKSGRRRVNGSIL
jgi:hypothetical protein